MTVKFTVVGTAQPAGSKRAFAHKSTGRIIVTDANARSRPWKALVSDAALQAMLGIDGQSRVLEILPPLDGPLHLELTFWVSRPKSHYGTGSRSGILKPGAPRFPTVKPDLLKLARGVEDALTGICYRDDAQIAVETLQKAYGEPARVEVRVVALERATVGEATA